MEPGAAQGWAAGGRMDGDQRLQPAMVVMTDHDLLVIAQLLEDGELGTCHVSAAFLICRA
jgi:hypothetical protein